MYKYVGPYIYICSNVHVYVYACHTRVGLGSGVSGVFNFDT